MTKKIICLVVPTLKRGGMERVMSELANYAVISMYDVHLILLLREKIEYQIDRNVTIYQPQFSYKKSLKDKIKVIAYMVRILKGVNPDTVLSFGEIFNSLSIIACLLTSNKIYISDRSSPLKKKGFLNDLLRKILYPLAAGFIAQTHYAKEIFRKRGYNKNMIAIGNPLKSMEEAEPGTPNKNIIVSIGRLTTGKNHEELIRIFKQINLLEWSLYIIGDGYRFTYLSSLIEELGLSNNVFLPGATEDVDSWLKKADIFAYSSLSEGFPNALSEAVAFPLPCIAYDCPAGPSEIIENNISGILIPLNNKDLYLLKLKSLMLDHKLREDLKSRAILNRQKFSIENIGSQYLDFITTV